MAHFTRLLVLVLALLSGAPRAAAESVLRVARLDDPLTLDWGQAYTVSEAAIITNIMDGLVTRNARLEPAPGLAESWTESPDHRTYVFHLRPGIVWSDGKALTAADFVFSWRRLLSPLVKAAYSYLLYDLEGARDFKAGKLKDPGQIGVRAVNERTLEVRLREPRPAFLQMLALWPTFPLREDLVAKFGPEWTKPGQIAVVGPFLVASHVPHGDTVLVRNPRYFGTPPRIDRVVIQRASTDQAAIDLFKGGRIDFTPVDNLSLLGPLEHAAVFHAVPFYQTTLLDFATDQYPITLPSVRRAIARSLDQALVARAQGPHVKPATSFVPPEIFPEGAGLMLSHDDAAAAKLLATDVVKPAGLAPLTIAAVKTEGNARVVAAIAAQLEHALGLKVTIKLLDRPAYRNDHEVNASMMYLSSWSADYVDPETYMTTELSDSGTNRANWKSARYDELVGRALHTTDRAARSGLYREALKLLLDEQAAMVPLYFNVSTYLLAPNVEGFVLNPLGILNFRDVSIK